jgi:hypothetical protein
VRCYSSPTHVAANDAVALLLLLLPQLLGIMRNTARVAGRSNHRMTPKGIIIASASSGQSNKWCECDRMPHTGMLLYFVGLDPSSRGRMPCSLLATRSERSLRINALCTLLISNLRSSAKMCSSAAVARGAGATRPKSRSRSRCRSALVRPVNCSHQYAAMHDMQGSGR